MDTLTKLLDGDMEGWEDDVKKMQKQTLGVEGEEGTEEEEKDLTSLIPESADDLDKDDDEDTTGEDNEEGEEEEEEDDDPLNSLKAELDQLKKERRGLFKDLKHERKIRQDMSSQMQNLNAVVNQISQQRQAAQNAGDAGAQTPRDITVEFDEEGEAKIPTDKLMEMIVKPLEEKINSLTNHVQSTTVQNQQINQAQELMNEIISEDERFSDAQQVYKKARGWLEEQVIEFQKANNIGGVVTPGEALDYIFDEDLTEEFGEMFPKVDMESVLMAEESPSGRFYRKALAGIADVIHPAKEEKEEISMQKAAQQKKFKKVLEKPNGLGQSASKQGKSVLDVAGNLSSLDALTLSDGQVDALMTALEREEKTGGIQF